MDLIRGANQAHRVTEVSVVPAAGVEVAVVEEHAVRAVAIAARGRPVAAVAAHTTDRSPLAVARGCQEDRAMRLKGICPSGGTNHIATEARATAVRVA